MATTRPAQAGRPGKKKADAAVPPPPRPGRRRVEERLRELALGSDTPTVRGRLGRLATLVADDGDDFRGLERLEKALTAVIAVADVEPRAEDCWLEREAAGWCLAWLIRSRRTTERAGGLLEGLVAVAKEAAADLEAGETQAAPFVLTLAGLFSDIDGCLRLGPAAAAAVSREIERLVSASGVVALHGGEAVVSRVARWCECRRMLGLSGEESFGGETESRFQGAVSYAVRLLAGGGRLPEGGGRIRRDPAVALRRTLKKADKPVRRSARGLEKAAGGRVGKTLDGQLLPRDLNDSGSGFALLRTGWHADAVRLLIDYRDATPRLELAVRDRLLFDGPWTCTLQWKGQPLEVEGPWEIGCWESQEEAAYLEISATLGDGFQLDRSILLVPRDRLLVLADAVTIPEAFAGEAHELLDGPLDYRAELQAAAGVEMDTDDEAREVHLYDARMRLLAMPLSLPEWKSRGQGGLEADGRRLVLSQRAARGRLYAPLWCDLDPQRFAGQVTWRQLTVADTRRILEPHEAAGFRVQAGLEQWLLYRTLDEPRNRTLLGCNLSCEYFFGRIEPKGMVERTLEVE